MDSRYSTRKRAVVFFLMISAISAQADDIDPFTAAKGPFTVGPNEEISEQDAVTYSSSVLGGFRVAVPVVGDDAAGGSETTLSIGGGTFTCTIDFPSVSEDNGGGCSSGYDRDEGPVFDLSGSTRFEFDVLSVLGGMTLGVTLVDTNERVSIGYAENIPVGTRQIPFNQMFSPPPLAGADLKLIDNISFVIINSPGQDGSATLGRFGTDGSITGGPIVPSDDIDPEEVGGSYYNADRDGEGCQLTREGDGVTFILTCYFYKNGKQFWLIGTGVMTSGQITIANMTITSGADFGPDFDPNDVVRDTWGAALLTWGDCNNLELDLLPVLQGYEQVTLELTRVVPVTCGAGRPQSFGVPGMGTFYDPFRDGEGFQLGSEGDGSVFVMTWYTYLDGEQVWLIGVGTRNGNQIVFEEMILTGGADFGSAFDPNDVVREVFGQIVLDFDDCNNATATVDSVLPQFSDIVLDVTKVVPGACP